VKFANESVRVAADNGLGAYMRAGGLLGVWSGQGVGVLVPDTAEEVIDGPRNAQGAPVDGRSAITCHDMHEVVAFVAAFTALLDANGGRFRTVLTKVAVNPR